MSYRLILSSVLAKLPFQLKNNHRPYLQIPTHSPIGGPGLIAPQDDLLIHIRVFVYGAHFKFPPRPQLVVTKRSAFLCQPQVYFQAMLSLIL